MLIKKANERIYASKIFTGNGYSPLAAELAVDTLIEMFLKEVTSWCFLFRSSTEASLIHILLQKRG
jgi:hypothetical protein